ncbi:LacI family DNA-binding transcriptional regulator [Pseudonocardia spinosispora]|uniref:LacI family DNA-binding transcriptional regulator n=1 Tax=Pseudonocardia spinosispora TaxID=103441 RepID=UPI0003FF1B93|nr:LacI family DNA-binding transcriptional regulator [Pseudonocardia spinosispora]
MQQRATLLDVATEAGVSRSTASRVLTGTLRNVDPQLAERVLEASQRLGYRANPVARALRRQSTGNVGILVPSIRNSYFVHLVDAFTRVANRSHFGVVLADSGDDPELESRRIDAFGESLVDALAVVPTSVTASGPSIRRALERTRVVQVDRWTAGVDCGFVGVDNEAGIRLMVEHLRSNGRRRIAYIGADQDTSAGVERLAAFRAHAHPGDREILLPHFSTSAGHHAAQRLLADGPLPDAALCTADVLAVGLLSTLQKEGVKVPDDIAVTGFDGTDLLELMNPPITALRHPLDAIAERALELMLGPSVPAHPEKVRLPPELVARSTS